MLDILRKKADSWLTKGILLTIVVVFVFYFGWSALRQKGNAPSVIATINGEPILKNEVDRLVNRQFKGYQQMYQEDPPELMKEQFQNMALNSLVRDKIILSEAKKTGLRVSDAEIRDIIINDPEFAVNGTFDTKRYHEVYKPSFFERNGVDFEEFLRNEKLKEKFLTLIGESLYISDNELKKRFEVENTKISIKSIALDPLKLASDFKPEPAEIEKLVEAKKVELANPANNNNEILEVFREEAASELKSMEGEKIADKLSLEIWPLFSMGKPVDELLKKAGLKEKEIPLTSLSQARSFFSGETDVASLKELLKLTGDKPYPEKPLKVGKIIHLIKLQKKEEPPWDQFEKKRGSLKEKMAAELKENYFTALYQEALTRTKVHDLRQN